MNYPNMLSDCKSSYFDSRVYDFFGSLMVSQADSLARPFQRNDAVAFHALVSRSLLLWMIVSISAFFAIDDK